MGICKLRTRIFAHLKKKKHIHKLYKINKMHLSDNSTLYPRKLKNIYICFEKMKNHSGMQHKKDKGKINNRRKKPAYGKKKQVIKFVIIYDNTYKYRLFSEVNKKQAKQIKLAKDVEENKEQLNVQYKVIYLFPSIFAFLIKTNLGYRKPTTENFLNNNIYTKQIA